jgi:glycosyltransferase involved in cell wall biosynthesis
MSVAMDSLGEPFFSIIVPVHNGRAFLDDCLKEVHASSFADWELIVVDDGSTDGSAAVAGRRAAVVLKTPRRCGPAAARNLGAACARGRYLLFLDADCLLHGDALTRAAEILSSDPDLAALFGSYDDRPAASNTVSQYKNLLHHYVHHHSPADASTFWAGCGAISRQRFQDVGAFDARRYPRPSIEDIELGYRLRRAGGRIRLAPEVQVTHLKRWDLPSLIRSDVLDRALPWSRLIVRSRHLPLQLNLQWSFRFSVALALLLPGAILLGRRGRWPLVLNGLTLLWLNRDLYRFFCRRRGPLFLLPAILLHWLHFVYSGLAFATALGLALFERPSSAGRDR